LNEIKVQLMSRKYGHQEQVFAGVQATEKKLGKRERVKLSKWIASNFNEQLNEGWFLYARSKDGQARMMGTNVKGSKAQQQQQLERMLDEKVDSRTSTILCSPPLVAG
jgi:hypothetical protein